MQTDVLSFKHLVSQRMYRQSLNRLTFGPALKRSRKSMEMTLEEAAKDICSVSYLSKVENNLIEVSPRFYEKLVKRFSLHEAMPTDPILLNHVVLNWMNFFLNQESVTRDQLRYESSYEGDHLSLMFQYLDYVWFHGPIVPLNQLHMFFDVYDDQQFFLIIYSAAQHSISKGFYEEAYQILNPIALTLDLPEVAQLVLKKILIDIGFHCRKHQLMEQHFTSAQQLGIQLKAYDTLDFIVERLHQYQAIFQTSVESTPYEIFFKGHYEAAYRACDKLCQSSIMALILLFYMKEWDQLEMKLLKFPIKTHIVVLYLKQILKNDEEMLRQFMKQEVLKSSLQHYDYLTNYFMHMEAIHFFQDHQLYKDASELGLKSMMTLELIQKS
jgi:HTH-type transcriptional regulator, quorum sensing regulator NprR